MIISKGPLYALNVLLFYQKDFHPTDSKPWNLESGLWSLVFRGSGGGRPCCCGFGFALVVATDRYLVTAGCLVVVGDCHHHHHHHLFIYSRLKSEIAKLKLIKAYLKKRLFTMSIINSA